MPLAIEVPVGRGPRQCFDKVRYRSKHIARKVARIASRSTGDHLHAYYCEHHRRWHIGHVPGSPR